MNYPVLLGRDILKHYHVDVTKETAAEGDDSTEESDSADTDKQSEE